jgi:hypothetical protein
MRKRMRQDFTHVSAKRLVVSIFAALFFLLMTTCGGSSQVKAGAEGMSASTSNAPSITVSPNVAEHKPGAKLMICGSGFEPGQKLRLFITMGGIRSGIHFLVRPEPVPNGLGAFASVWTLKREISKKLIEPLPMVYTLAAQDKEGNTLCTAPVLFCDPDAKEKAPACEFLK